MRLALKHINDTLEVTLQNNPTESAIISSPSEGWLAGIGGIEFKIWTFEGRYVSQCSMIDYTPGLQKKEEIKPSEKITKVFENKYLKENYCLSSKQYFVQTIFHNQFNGVELSKRYSF